MKVSTQIAQATKLVSLLPVSESSFAQLLAWASNPNFWEFFRRFPPLCDWGTWERASQMLQGFYVILEDQTLAGICFVGNYDFHARSYETGLLVDPSISVQKALTARLAGQALCDYAFSYLGASKVVCRLLTHREKLGKRLEDNGFKHEGTLRASCLGSDELLYSCLAADYRKVI